MATAPEYKKPLPHPTELSRPFWEGTRQGKLLVQHCAACHFWIWTPQAACPKCLKEDWEWTLASGRGTVYSFTVVHRPPDPVAFANDVPYVIAVVELAEGAYMQTNIVGCPPGDVHVGMPVQVTFEKATDNITLYKFRPAG